MILINKSSKKCFTGPKKGLDGTKDDTVWKNGGNNSDAWCDNENVTSLLDRLCKYLMRRLLDNNVVTIIIKAQHRDIRIEKYRNSSSKSHSNSELRETVIFKSNSTI
ncbi:hypothetical protein TNCV_5085091 [Trichonephila clavipes]|uniref:Uncharacterized protein n=1 Tax=Trichonephila clavipes TaxID=2585209 RepID=A0A8X6S4I4_TRICX|nr:hypothetical protein TNCV_5085071 [Trichonephila clavipes]GFY07322.1 hypothetical protein TNCV_5085091 [Trichonephila clavipes]